MTIERGVRRILTVVSAILGVWGASAFALEYPQILRYQREQRVWGEYQRDTQPLLEQYSRVVAEARARQPAYCLKFDYEKWKAALDDALRSSEPKRAVVIPRECQDPPQPDYPPEPPYPYPSPGGFLFGWGIRWTSYWSWPLRVVIPASLGAVAALVLAPWALFALIRWLIRGFLDERGPKGGTQ